jgi:hypothetical protein
MGASIENSKAAYHRYLLKINELEDNLTEPVPLLRAFYKFHGLYATAQMRAERGRRL